MIRFALLLSGDLGWNVFKYFIKNRNRTTTTDRNFSK